MSESSKFKYGMVKEKTVDGFINDIMEDNVDFDYSTSYQSENNEAYSFINELHLKIIRYLKEDKSPENNAFYEIQTTLNNPEDKNKKKRYLCMRCGYEMTEMTVCHLKCFRCGAEHDCSDKGNFW